MNPVHWRRPQPLPLRIWHWISALLVCALLGTVYLRNGFLSASKNSEIIADSLAPHSSLNPEDVKHAAAAIRDRMFEWHFYLGLAFSAFFCFRILFGKRSILPKVRRDFGQGAHYGIVKLGYFAFYCVTAYMVFSGLVMYLGGHLHWFYLDKTIQEPLQDLHEWAQWFFVAYIILHVGGVVFRELTDSPGMTSDMIHGNKEQS